MEVNARTPDSLEDAARTSMVGLDDNCTSMLDSFEDSGSFTDNSLGLRLGEDKVNYCPLCMCACFCVLYACVFEFVCVRM